MRGTVSKQLRKAAKNLGGDSPWESYQEAKVIISNPRNPMFGVQPYGVSIILAECQKMLYRHMKKIYKRSK